MESEFVELNMGEIKIEFINSQGEKIKYGDGELVRSNGFLISGPGIDPDRVRSVELPKLDYASTEALTVKVEMYPVMPTIEHPQKVQTCRFEYTVPENPVDFDPTDFIEKALDWARDLVAPTDKVALSASGGVDSTIAAFLLSKVSGQNLYTFFIEDGCRRLINDKPEGEVTRMIFEDLNFSVLEVKNEVLPPLVGLSGGEEKRKAFISNYKAVSDKYIKEIGADWIADGTIAPDIRETEGGFKSQHNVGWDYTVRKLEPLASLSKPQVRKVGEALGLPVTFTHRIPCPGPAQIVRTVGEFNEEKLNVSQRATDKIEQLVEEYYAETEGQPYIYDDTTGIRTPFQYFGVALAPTMESDSELTALAKEIGLNAECFKMSAQTTVVPAEGTRPDVPIYKPVSWIKVDGDINYDKLDELSKVAWEKLGLPRILLQLCENPDAKTKYLVGMRVVESAAAKEAKPVRFAQDKLIDMAKQIAMHSGTPIVAYDISHKPAATIEFE